MTDHHKTVPLEDVLTELALAPGEPDAALIDEFIHRFPEYAETLTSYAIAWQCKGASRNGPPPGPSGTLRRVGGMMRAMVGNGDVYRRRRITGDAFQCGCRWEQAELGDVLHECPIHKAATIANVAKLEKQRKR